MISVAMLFHRRCLFSIVAIAAIFASPPAHAQSTTATDPMAPVSPSLPSVGPTPFGNPSHPDPEQTRMIKEMSRQRNAIRQKEIVADTDQLLDLARQLKDAVDKSSKDQLSLAVVNEASEIEKLAKIVKEKMRDGN